MIEWIFVVVLSVSGVNDTRIIPVDTREQCLTLMEAYVSVNKIPENLVRIACMKKLKLVVPN